MVFLPRFYFALAVIVLLALCAASPAIGILPCQICTLLLGVAVLVEFACTPRDVLRARREAPGVLLQGQSAEVKLHLQNVGEAGTQLLVTDSPPASFTEQPEIFALDLARGAEKRLSYRLRSFQRGTFAFGALYYRVRGRFGLLQRQTKIVLPNSVLVLPDLAGSDSRGLQFARANARQLGQRRAFGAGAGQEFESLREHLPDDDFRHIDWKASARRGRLITRQNELERDQRVMLLIDHGRAMSPKVGACRKLDYAVNAAIHLAQICQQEGDQVGYAIFNQEVSAFAEPSKRSTLLSRLVQDITPLQATREDSNFRRVFQQILQRCPRRTLVVCFTDLGDLHASEGLRQALQPLRPRHIPLIVTVSNSEIEAITGRLPDTQWEVYRYVAANEWWADYQRSLRRLRAFGLLTVSVPAEQLSAAAIQEYLRIKRSTRW